MANNKYNKLLICATIPENLPLRSNYILVHPKKDENSNSAQTKNMTQTILENLPLRSNYVLVRKKRITETATVCKFRNIDHRVNQPLRSNYILVRPKKNELEQCANSVIQKRPSTTLCRLRPFGRSVKTPSVRLFLTVLLQQYRFHGVFALRATSSTL